METHEERLKKFVKEIIILHNINESEEILMLQMMALIRMMGLSPPLTSKLLKAMSAIMEISVDLEKEIEGK